MNIKTINLLIVLISSLVHAGFIVKQGSITLDFEDVDGYAYTIPAKDRGGVFDSLERLDTILKNLINIEHLANYAVVNLSQQLNYQNIKGKANLLALRDIDALRINNPYLLHDLEKSLIESYYQKKLLVVALEKYYKDKIKNEDIIEIAKEDYFVNRHKYAKNKSYNITYLVINFDQVNKLEKKLLANDLLRKIKQEEVSIDELAGSYDYKKHNIDYVKSINEFTYDDNNFVFSNIVFGQTEVGLINEIIQADYKRFIIVKINKINPKQLQSFKDIKEKLLEKHRKIKSKNDYKTLLLSITQDSFEVKDENIKALRTRYKVQK
ncbi:MAG: hypothetical protein L3J83_06210 [Proteobacteria bacterium]|nr:hypothetical protein [Pseudomonadota bacterium]